MKNTSGTKQKLFRNSFNLGVSTFSNKKSPKHKYEKHYIICMFKKNYDSFLKFLKM